MSDPTLTPCTCPTRDALDAALTDAIKRRASVEQALWDMALGKQPLPDKDKLRELAKHLGMPGSAAPVSDVDAAVAAERERCAKLCEGIHARRIAEHGDYIGETYAAECARLIRA